MIVLDTNVLSEPSKNIPDAAVLAWLERQPPEALFTTAINVMELYDGVGRLPQGARRKSLEAVNSAVLASLDDRILPFDAPAAAAYADMINGASSRGFTIGMGDGMIAAIAALKGFAVATADERPFMALGLQVINPWTA